MFENLYPMGEEARVKSPRTARDHSPVAEDSDQPRLPLLKRILLDSLWRSISLETKLLRIVYHRIPRI